MRAALAACVLTLVANSASAQFELDISSRDFNRMFGNPMLSDLAVNERGYISPWSVCADDGGLFVITDTQLWEPMDSGGQLVARRLPENMLEISIYVGTRDSTAQEKREEIIRNIANPSVCEAARTWRADLEFFQIQSIDGHEYLSQLVASQR